VSLSQNNKYTPIFRISNCWDPLNLILLRTSECQSPVLLGAKFDLSYRTAGRCAINYQNLLNPESDLLTKLERGAPWGTHIPKVSFAPQHISRWICVPTMAYIHTVGQKWVSTMTRPCRLHNRVGKMRQRDRHMYEPDRNECLHTLSIYYLKQFHIFLNNFLHVCH
jgi:hypothetical protein